MGTEDGPLISVKLLVSIILVLVIVLCTIDLHFGVVWDAPARMNSEFRYGASGLLVGLLLFYTCCKRRF